MPVHKTRLRERESSVHRSAPGAPARPPLEHKPSRSLADAIRRAHVDGFAKETPRASPVDLEAGSGPWHFLTEAEFDDLPPTGSIDPGRIRFSQGSMSPVFRPPYGKLSDLVDGLRKGEIAPTDSAPIRIVKHRGMVFSLDNRRLYCFHQAGLPVSYEKIAEVPERELFKFTNPSSGAFIGMRAGPAGGP